MMRLRGGWLVLAAGCFASGTAAFAVTIDDFSVGSLVLVGPAGPTSFAGLDPNHVIGGRRQISVGIFPSAPNVLTINTAAGELEFDTGAGPALGSLSLVYGATTPLGAALNADGHGRIKVTFPYVNAGGTLVAALQIRDAANQAFSYPLGNAIKALDGVGGIVEFPFSAASAVDFGNVSRISIDLLNYPVNGTFAIAEVTTAGTPLAGDYNRDGRVDIDDYAEWKRLYGRSVVGPVILAADGNGDQRIDGGDYVVWRNHLGTTDGGEVLAAVVPEPTTVCLFSIIAVFVASRRTLGVR